MKSNLDIQLNYKNITFETLNVVKKGWGSEIHIVNNDKYCGKLLVFNKKNKFSCHYHLIKHETFYVLSGKFLLKYFDLRTGNEETKELVENDTVVIPPGNPHQLTCLSELGGTIIEFSTTDYKYDNYRIAPGDSQK